MKKRIVVKVGTSTLTLDDGNINLRTMNKLAQVLSALHHEGNEVILVSSGAIAVGVNKMRLPKKPTELRFKQATAAVGQCELMHMYDLLFGEYGCMVGQILLTGDDILNDSRRNNLINTFDALLESGIIPIVNENDSVSATEIESEKKVFGDNDMLSAIVADLCHGDELIIMSDIEGLYNDNPRTNPMAKVIHKVEDVESVFSYAHGSGTNRGTGGMDTKLQAAKYVTDRGIDMYITRGNKPENLYDILAGKEVGTWFVSKEME